VTVYSVYEPPAKTPDMLARAETLAFVKEGFSWPALRRRVAMYSGQVM
jgi:hypothetical protein